MSSRLLRQVQLLVAFLVLFAGATIYLLFRSKMLVGFHVADAVGLGGAVDWLRSIVSDVHPADFVTFCLPDGLWTTSYILFIDYVLRKSPVRMRMLTAEVIPLIGSVSEVMQYMDMLPGTFDVMDILCYMVPLLVYTAILGVTQYADNQRVK